MKRLANICSAFVVIGLLLLGGCQKQAAVVEERPVEAPGGEPTRGFDPLELTGDKQIIPLTNPQTGAVVGKTGLVVADAGSAKVDSLDVSIEQLPEAVDTVNSQAYRVQLATSKLYGDAQRSVAIAEEIFDRPVFVDYEVPYFKVRVGSFASRDDAEAYSQKAKAAGYTNAWVVMVIIDKREPIRLYPDVPENRQQADSILTDSLIREYEKNEADFD